MGRSVAVNGPGSVPELPADALSLLRQGLRPAEIRAVVGEPMELPAAPPDRWTRGYRLRGLLLEDGGQTTLPAFGALDPGSLVVRTGGGRILQRDRDYLLDAEWGTLGLDGAMISPGPLTVDYRYSLRRIDSVVQDGNGQFSVISGHSGLAAVLPPALSPGAGLVANAFVPYFSDGTEPEIFVPSEPPRRARPVLDRLPRTSALLDSGEPLKVVCWGDSITTGCEASSFHTAYPAATERLLRQRYPDSPITVVPVAVGGSCSRDWLRSDEKPRCDWALIAAERPDLVVVEFVNDANLAEPDFAENYAEICDRVTALGADLLLTTPPFTLPAWMTTNEAGGDGRPYTAFIRRYTEERHIALADIAASWEHLEREGLPYVTLLNNGVNHPDDRGHAMFARTLAQCLGA